MIRIVVIRDELGFEVVPTHQASPAQSCRVANFLYRLHVEFRVHAALHQLFMPVDPMGTCLVKQTGVNRFESICLGSITYRPQKPLDIVGSQPDVDFVIDPEAYSYAKGGEPDDVEIRNVE